MDTLEKLRTLKAMQTTALGQHMALRGLEIDAPPGLFKELRDAAITARNHAQAIGHAIGVIETILSGDAARPESGR